MQLVIDANIIIAMLLKSGKPIDLFFLEELELFAPELLFKELNSNKEVIIQKTAITSEEIAHFFLILKEKITIVPEEYFLKQKEDAEKICPDTKDIPYFALALFLCCPLWSNDKKLQEQQFLRIYTTYELLELFHLR